MRKTIKSLEETITDLNREIERKTTTITMLKEMLRIYQGFQPASLTIALERVTQALAHVISELNPIKR